jgi:Concanavalin A-like lectin/glucanases superfamily
VVRVYDYALSATAVQSLAAQYLSPPSGNCPSPSTGTGGDSLVYSLVPRAPVFNANFSVPPNCSIGVTPAWTWMQTDPLDSGNTAALHQGVAIMTGNSTSWIDLTTATGPQSSGLVLPMIGGAGNYPLGNPLCGWSFEVVAKFDQTVNQQYAKLIELSDGPGGGAGNNLALSFYGSDAGDDSAYKLMVEQYMNTTAVPNANHGIVEFLQATTNTWYHIVIGMQPAGSLTSGQANWFIYVNGQPVAYASALLANATLTVIQGANYPLLVPRPISTLGKSAWSDPNVQATVDSFRVYDYLLPAATVSALANAYGLNIPAPVQVSYQFPVTAETNRMLAVVPNPPVFNAPFSQNPSSDPAIGSNMNYQWFASDPNDTPANQQLHQGLIWINGSASSFVNLAVASGPNSIGVVLPVLGLPGSGNGSSQGLTVEVVIKFQYILSSWWRQKIFDFGQGASADSFDFGLDGAALTGGPFQLFLENQNNVAPYIKNYGYGYASTPFYPALANGTWYHLVWVLSQPNFSNYTATWTAYVNGVLQTPTPYASGLFPLPVSRPFSWLGGSDWTDSNLPLFYDVVRVYDYALSATAVQSLAAQYLSPPSQGSSSSAASAPTAQPSSSTGTSLPVGVQSSTASTASATTSPTTTPTSNSQASTAASSIPVVLSSSSSGGPKTVGAGAVATATFSPLALVIAIMSSVFVLVL